MRVPQEREGPALGHAWGALRRVSYGVVVDEFEDVSGLFACAEGLRHDVLDGDGILSVPYEGSFDLEVVHRRYVMEDGRREFVDRELAPVHHVCDVGGTLSWDRWDPVGWLLRPSDLGGPLGRGPGEGERRASRARVPGRLRRRLSLLRVVRVSRLRSGRGGPCRPREPRVRRRAGGEGHTRRAGR